MTPCEILSWVLSQGGAMVLAHFLMEKVKWLHDISDMFWKRVAAFAIAASIAMLVFVMSVAVACNPAPADWLGWLNQLTVVATSAIGLSQLLHAADHDRQRHKDMV